MSGAGFSPARAAARLVGALIEIACIAGFVAGVIAIGVAAS